MLRQFATSACLEGCGAGVGRVVRMLDQQMAMVKTVLLVSTRSPWSLCDGLRRLARPMGDIPSSFMLLEGNPSPPHPSHIIRDLYKVFALKY